MAYKLLERYYHIPLMSGIRASLFLAERFGMHNVLCLTILQTKEIIPEFERKDIHFRQVERLDAFVLDSLEPGRADLMILTESKNLDLELRSYV